MEENYFEMQFQENYYRDFNKVVAPNFEFSDKGDIISINTPLKINPADRKILLSYLWKIQVNRNFIMSYYANMESKIQDIIQRIKKGLSV